MSLAPLGVSPASEQIYRLLAGRAGATAADIGDELGIGSDTVAAALAAMSEAGLVARAGGTAGGDTKFVAAPPSVSLGSLVNQQRDDLRRAEHVVAELAEVYRVAVGARAGRELIEVVTGVEAIRHRLEQVQRAAMGELLAFVTAETTVITREQNEEEGHAVARGVNYRVVLERAVMEQPGAFDAMLAATRNGEEIRTVPTIPMKLVIADRSLALVPLLNAGEPGAVLVHASGLLDALVALFESIWLRAIPLRVDAEGLAHDDAAATVALDGKILSLLLTGLTDQAVATQLGISMRTVARRIRHLMDVAGVDTRLQLGWHAARAGWA
jgi:DNA-binding NarL/FixJ family response regulator/predicted DNA-binding transcriptional regulator